MLAIAGVAKLADRKGAEQAARDFGLGRFAPGVAVMLPLVELALAAALVPASSARIAAVGAVLLLAAFTVAIATALARGRRPDCHCFGRLHSSASGPTTLLRNAGLAAVAVVVAGRPAAPVGWIELSVSGAGVLVGAQALLAYVLLRRYGRALRRIEELEAGVERPAALAVGDEAPEVELPQFGAGETTLRGLLEPGRALLLVFVDPGCGPCHALLPELAGWIDDRVLPVFVSRGDLDTNAVFAEYGEVLLQREHEVAELYGAHATPSAVLIDPDGRIARPLAIGRDAIRELVEAVRPRLGAAVAVPRGATGIVVAAGAAAVAAASTAGAIAAPANPILAEIDQILEAAGPRLASAAKAASGAVRAQATLKTGGAQRAKQAAARKALEAERRELIALRTRLMHLTIGSAAGRDATNARTFAVVSLDLFAQSLQKQENAIGAKPKVAATLVAESRKLLLRSIDASAAAAKLLGRTP